MYTTIGIYYSFQMNVCCLGWIGIDSNPTRTTDSHLKRIININCCIHMVVPPDDGPRYARNMQRLTKYTKNKLCIELVFLCTIISRCTVKKTKNGTCSYKKLPEGLPITHVIQKSPSSCRKRRFINVVFQILERVTVLLLLLLLLLFQAVMCNLMQGC